MLSDRCPVLSVLSIISVYFGQTVGWIKMKLGVEVGLGPGHTCVRWGPSPLPPKGHNPHQFSAHICCSQMAGWIKMPLGMEVGLDPGDFVLDGDPVLLPQKGAEPPLFGPCLLWPQSPISATAELLWWNATLWGHPNGRVEKSAIFRPIFCFYLRNVIR